MNGESLWPRLADLPESSTGRPGRWRPSQPRRSTSSAQASSSRPSPADVTGSARR